MKYLELMGLGTPRERETHRREIRRGFDFGSNIAGRVA